MWYLTSITTSNKINSTAELLLFQTYFRFGIRCSGLVMSRFLESASSQLYSSKTLRLTHTATPIHSTALAK